MKIEEPIEDMPKVATPPILVIVLTLNEEQNLPDCLASLRGLDCGILVVDSGSSDRTVEIAEEYGARVLLHPFENYARQRNWAFENAGPNSEWIVNLDADERLTPEIVTELNSLARSDDKKFDGYMFRKRTYFLGRWIKHGGQYPAYHLRMVRNGQGYCEDRLYDQHFKVRSGKIGKTRNDYIDIITSGLSEWVERHNKWAALEAMEILAQHGSDGPDNQVTPRLFGNAIERKRFLRTKVYQRFPLFIRPFIFFLYGYFLRMGFLDGKEGLIFHVLQRFWFRFLVDAKIFEMTRDGQHATSDR